MAETAGVSSALGSRRDSRAGGARLRRRAAARHRLAECGGRGPRSAGYGGRRVPRLDHRELGGARRSPPVHGGGRVDRPRRSTHAGRPARRRSTAGTTGSSGGGSAWWTDTRSSAPSRTSPTPRSGRPARRRHRLARVSTPSPSRASGGGASGSTTASASAIGPRPTSTACGPPRRSSVRAIAPAAPRSACPRDRDPVPERRGAGPRGDLRGHHGGVRRAHELRESADRGAPRVPAGTVPGRRGLLVRARASAGPGPRGGRGAGGGPRRPAVRRGVPDAARGRPVGVGARHVDPGPRRRRAS